MKEGLGQRGGIVIVGDLRTHCVTLRSIGTSTQAEGQLFLRESLA